jgi:hypothetical protein
LTLLTDNYSPKCGTLFPRIVKKDSSQTYGRYLAFDDKNYIMAMAGYYEVSENYINMQMPLIAVFGPHEDSSSFPD